jgi:hypothetical protein
LHRLPQDLALGKEREEEEAREGKKEKMGPKKAAFP